MFAEEAPHWIKSIHSGKCLDICQDNNKKRGTAILYDYFGGKNQQFTFKKQGDLYIIQCEQTGKVLDVITGLHQDGAVIREMEFNGNLSQKWRIVQTGPHSQEYIIMTGLGNKVLDVCNEKKSNGAQIFLYESKQTHNQIWQFIHADDGEYPLKGMGTGKMYYKYQGKEH